MTVELGMAISIIGISLALATFYIGRQITAKNSGQEWGELKADIKYIKNDITEIKVCIGENSKVMMAAIEKEEMARKEAIRRLHERFDEHLKMHHM